jgi:hypothetical protein
MDDTLSDEEINKIEACALEGKRRGYEYPFQGDVLSLVRSVRALKARLAGMETLRAGEE